MKLSPLFLFLFPLNLVAATLTGTLKPSAVNLGNSAILTLRYEGGTTSTVQQTTTPKNLALTLVSSGEEISLVNGQKKISSTFTYKVTPRVAGRFFVPAFKTNVNGKEIQSDPLPLTVFNSDGSDLLKNTDTQPPSALLRVSTPAKRVYVGEVFPVAMELLGRGLLGGGQLPVPQVATEGVRFTRIRPNYRSTRGRSIGSAYYPIAFLFDTGAIAMKPGKMNLTFELDVIVQDARRSVFPERQKLHLTSEPIELEVIALPKENRPANFNGSVGQYLMSASAKPTRVKVGDPIELSITLSGQGALDNAPSPEADTWDNFKTYPATSQIQYTDIRHLNSRKTFQRMIIPTSPKLTQLPTLKFSYFDPRKEQYVTLTTPPIPIEVTGSAIPANPTEPSSAPNEPQTAENTPNIRTIKSAPGQLAEIQPPLIARPWFLAIPATGLFAFLAAFAFRKRVEYLKNNPDVARKLHVERITRETMRSLNSSETQNDPNAFFAGVQLILRENIGITIDRPAEGITLKTMKDSGLSLPNESQKSLEKLFEQDELVRFANSPEQMDTQRVLKELNRVLRDLR